MSKRAMLAILVATTMSIALAAAVSAIGQGQKTASAESAPRQSGKRSRGAAAADPARAASATPAEAKPSARQSAQDDLATRLEGEQRFHQNCGRCHMAPPKFPPRAMATILRHMRVRAMLNAKDQNLILRYMTE